MFHITIYCSPEHRYILTGVQYASSSPSSILPTIESQEHDNLTFWLIPCGSIGGAKHKTFGYCQWIPLFNLRRICYTSRPTRLLRDQPAITMCYSLCRTVIVNSAHEPTKERTVDMDRIHVNNMTVNYSAFLHSYLHHAKGRKHIRSKTQTTIL